jgi:AcrR family transcriptional regulator
MLEGIGIDARVALTIVVDIGERLCPKSLPVDCVPGVGEQRRGPYAKTAARRAAIVPAALESFAEHGYERASLRDIARRAGLTHAGLLHHFRDKDELLAAALTQRDAQDTERAAAAAAAAGLPAADQLAEILEHNLRSPELVRTWAVLSAAASSPDHPARGYFTERYERVRHTIEVELANARDAGQGRPEVDSEAMLILAVLDGLQVQWLLNPGLDVVAAARRFAGLLRGTGT